ncbi:MAG: radical SAM family heme chaperone HemW [Mycoplasmatales bacterium]
MKSIYIHIPFCKYICSYCDFCKKYIKGQPVDLYLEYLEKEISLYLEDSINVDTIYIGGGTPSAMTNYQIQQLGNIVKKFFKLNKDYEFTFECNPDDIDIDKMLILKNMGVNRLSIGVQTINDVLNKKNNRMHTKKDVQNALDISGSYFENISLDFMFNLPEQTKKDVDDSIEFIKLNFDKIKHISYYSLILEENTILDTRDFVLMDEEEESLMYYYILKRLENIGFKQYEISNFSKDGYISRHNHIYWDNKKYYGFGLGASGYIDNIRFTNIKGMKPYFESIEKGVKPILESNQITEDDLLQEVILLGLRTTKGIKKDLLKNIKYDENNFDFYKDMMRIKKNRLFISNEIIVDLLEKLDE